MSKKTKKKIEKKHSKKLGKLPIWNLSDLYHSTNDKNIKSDLDIIKHSAIKFEKQYEGKIASLSAQALFKAIEKLQVINEKIDRIMSYAYLLYAENIDIEKNKIFLQQMKEKIMKYSLSLVFFELELNNINKTNLNRHHKSFYYQ